MVVSICYCWYFCVNRRAIGNSDRRIYRGNAAEISVGNYVIKLRFSKSLKLTIGKHDHL